MLVIRLTRKGRKNQPFFRVVVTDKRRSAKGGRAVEILGHIDPLTKKKALKKDRILYWIKMGAQPSDTVHNLLVTEKIIDAKKKHVAKVKAKPQDAATASASVSAPASVATATPIETPKVGEKPSADAKAMADKAENPPAVVVENLAQPPKEEPKKDLSEPTEAKAGG